MNPEKSPNRLRRLIIAGLLFCLLALILLFDPVELAMDAVASAAIRRELPEAVERWTNAAPPAYRIHLKGFIPLVCIVDAELIVQNGALTEVWARENPLVPDSPLVQVNDRDWESWGCPLDELTVEGMFQRVDTELKAAGLAGAPLKVTFDGQLGFITEYRSGRASAGGLLGPSRSECCSWFEFDSLEEQEP